MHAYLVIGSSQEKQKEEVDRLKKDYGIYDQNILSLTSDSSHGIESIREIIHFLTIQTTKKGELRAVVVEDAHLMTPEAQNAFLKTLEEPPRDTIIILTAPRDDLLLPTITSRCLIIPSELQEMSADFGEQKELFEKLSTSSIGEKITFVEQLGKDRGEALTFVTNQLTFFDHMLRTQSSKIDTHLGNALLDAYYDLTHNVNPKMILFELILNY